MGRIPLVPKRKGKSLSAPSSVGNLRVVLLKSVHCSESAGRSALLQALVLELDNPRAHDVWPVPDVEEYQLQVDVNNQLY